MSVFKKLTGNYVEMVNWLGLPKGFCGSSPKSEIDIQLKRDIPRMRHINYYGKIDALQKRLMDSVDAHSSFTQGDFYAGVFTETHLTSEIGRIHRDSVSDVNKFPLGFSYIDDEGNACGFSIAYLDGIEKSFEDKEVSFTVCRIKHVDKPPLEREVIYFTPSSLLLNKIENAEDIADSALANEINKVLNCKLVQHLLLGMIKEGQLNRELFKALKDRLDADPDHNIDGRDLKLNRLYELFVMWSLLMANRHQSEEKNRLMQELIDIINKAYQDANYFKNMTLREIDGLVSVYEKNALIQSLTPIANAAEFKEKLMHVVNTYYTHSNSISAKTLENEMQESFSDSIQQKQHFSVCNRDDLLLTSVALTAVVSTLLVLTGALAPVGLVIGAGFATELAIAGTSIAGLIAMQRILKIMDRKQTFKEKYQQGKNEGRAHTQEGSPSLSFKTELVF